MADTEYYDSGSDGESGKKQRRSTAGRKLMRWNPDLDQFVLLAVDIVCTEQGTPVPWNSVAEKINDWVTGEGIKQHLAKVRKYRQESGRRVPERSTKGGGRKASMLDSGVTDTPQRTPKKKSHEEGGGAPLTGKGASLLWNNPRHKLPKQQQPIEPKEDVKEPREQKEQKPDGGRKKADCEEAPLATPKTRAKKSRQSAIKDDDTEKGNNKKRSTGKRSRGKKEPSNKEEDRGEYLGNDSPTKKQRTLRATYHVNYNETQMADEFDADIFDARAQGVEDEDYDDGFYGSQPNTVLNSAYASSRISQKGRTTTPMQPPPDFDNMLHSRTGMHSYGEDYMNGGQSSNFGMFMGLNNSYGPGDYGGGQEMGMNEGDMMIIHGSQYNDPSQLSADQLQMHAQNTVYGGYGDSHQAHGSRYGATSARKARKQTIRDEDDEGTATPLGRKNKKKNQDSMKQASKDKASRKSRKDSVHDNGVIGEQQTGNFFADENLSNIPIANDTGRGLDQTFGQGMPNLTYPMTAFDQQQAPTDIYYDFKGGLPFPSTKSNFQNNSTGITPQFNNFSFGDTTTNTNTADFPMQSTEYNGGFGSYGHFGGDGKSMATLHSSFSSSNDLSAVGSQGDQTLPSMHFGTGDGAGLGMENAWMADATGMGMDTGGDSEQGHDMFSFVNQKSFH